MDSRTPKAESKTPWTDVEADKFSNRNGYTWGQRWNGLLRHARTLELALVAAEARLPVSMPDCTIVFKECEKGHGWLTATNWVQHDCPTCRTNAAEARAREAEKLLERCRNYTYEGPFVRRDNPDLRSAIDAAIARGEQGREKG
jgi:hypothetical protein